MLTLTKLWMMIQLEMVVTKSFCDLKMFLPFLVNYGRGSLKAALCSIATLVQLGI